MSGLTQFRDHCRRMADACDTVPLAAADAALWRRLADEIDDYLAPQPDLFGDVTPEPEVVL